MKMRFKIYQIEDIRNTDYSFRSWEEASKHGFSLADYKKVYSGERKFSQMLLDNLFTEFNINPPYDFRGHSLSMSDVIALEHEDGWSWHYCNDLGWKNITKVVEAEKEEELPTLCGFVFCHGNKDFSAWEVDLPEHVREKIQMILDDYVFDGTSERNVWDRKFSDVFNEKY